MAAALGYVVETLTVIVGGVVAGSKGRGKKPTPSDEEVVTGAPAGGNRGPRVPPLLIPVSTPTSTENVGTNRYSDNQDNNNQDCELFPYKDRKKKCDGKNAHHAVPDHCWRTTPGMQSTLADTYGIVGALAGAAIDKVAGSYYYPVKKDPISGNETGMNQDSGLAICVSGQGKTLKHGAIHQIFDKEETRLGENGDPKWTAKLGDLEDAAAKSIADATGCDKAYIKSQLRQYHESRDLKSDALLRADPSGKNTGIGKGDPVINSRNSGSED
jgi:hypothetical protein